MSAVTIPAAQKQLHVLTEAGSVFLIVPALWWISSSPALPDVQKQILRAAALVMLGVDGYLLWRWSRLS